MRNTILISITIVYTTIIISAHGFPQNLISELILSFSPYSIGISLFLLLLNILALRYSKQAKKIFHAFVILLLGGCIFLYGNMIHSFYEGKYTEISKEQTQNTTGMKILFSNIYRQNTQTEEIIETIEYEKPDIVALIEFSLTHKEKIYDKLREIYPYTNINQRSKIHAGNIIFSKYPIKNLIEETQQGSWRYNYVSIQYKGKKYYLYVVHTSAPISNHDFKSRNRQLSKITHDIQTHTQKRGGDAKVIMLGDFNVTPWSYFYRNTLDTMNLKNITKENNTLFTRKDGLFGILHAHIDHIFLSENIKTGKIKTFQLEGSDHKGFVLKQLQ